MKQAKTNKISLLLYYQYFIIHFNNFGIVFCRWSKMFPSKFKGSHSLEKKAISTCLENYLLFYTRNWNIDFVKTSLPLRPLSKKFLRPESLVFSISDLERIKFNSCSSTKHEVMSSQVNFHRPCWSIKQPESHKHIHFKRDSSLCQC